VFFIAKREAGCGKALKSVGKEKNGGESSFPETGSDIEFNRLGIEYERLVAGWTKACFTSSKSGSWPEFRFWRPWRGRK